MWWRTFGSRSSGTKTKFEASKAHKKKLVQKAKSTISKLEEKIEVQSKLKLFDRLNIEELKILCKLNDLKTTGKKDDLLAKLNDVEVTKELNELTHFEVTLRYLELKNNKPRTFYSAKTPASKKRKASTPASTDTAATDKEDEDQEVL
jgi:hypothetical protein